MLLGEHLVAYNKLKKRGVVWGGDGGPNGNYFVIHYCRQYLVLI